MTTLQERKKWKQETSSLKVGDVVYVTDDNTPRLQWPVARVFYVYSGHDEVCSSGEDQHRQRGIQQISPQTARTL